MFYYTANLFRETIVFVRNTVKLRVVDGSTIQFWKLSQSLQQVNENPVIVLSLSFSIGERSLTKSEYTEGLTAKIIAHG